MLVNKWIKYSYVNKDIDKLMKEYVLVFDEMGS